MNSIRDAIRRSKTLAGPFPDFYLNDVPELPHDLFLEWFQTALDHGVYEPHSMTLSTVDSSGFPDARVLIVKDVDREGWYFATSSKSEKGRHIEMKPHVAITFYWPQVGRQIRIRGTAQKMDKGRSASDFLNRGTVARAIALLDKQSPVLKDPLEFEKALAAEMIKVQEEPSLVSPSWVLYRVMAIEVEFWQADEERKHVRLKYTLEQNKWSRTRLWP